VHLDRVEGLATSRTGGGPAPEQTEAAGIAVADNLMQQLGVRGSDLISGAYVDLISGSA